ncbi:MAG: DUF1801 domain-containing protein [Cyclobacteriaceae bacterium]|nr:DUF1801 domain-containing protein [Cyclobacteriaceae bacterium]
MKSKSKYRSFENPDVAAVFDACPKTIRAKLMTLRELIFETAASTDGVGKLEETLKWGSPSYLTTETGSGTTIRIDRISAQNRKFAMCVHCQTTLVGPFKKIHGDFFIYDANRGLILDDKDELPIPELRQFVTMALTYHLSKKKKNRASF